MEKIENVSNPVIGETYLVKCTVSVLAYQIGDLVNWVPVVGEFHDDNGIGQPENHYHVDWRFMPQKYIDEIEQAYRGLGMFKNVVNTHNYVAVTEPMIKGFIAGMNNFNYHQLTKEELDKIEIVDQEHVRYMPLVYLRHFQSLEDNSFPKLVEIYKKAGTTMKNMTCPHKKTDLTSCEIINGIVQCPCHGLRWDVETGKLAS